jgi:nucleoid-associated protein YgaU
VARGSETGPPARPGVAATGSKLSPRRTRLPADARTHVIGAGDTLAILAEQYYGQQSYAGYLVEVNPGLNPNRLIVGTRILVPHTPGDTSVINPILATPKPPAKRPAPATTAARPAASGETYTVQSGDSLWRIAKRSLGDESRWREIFELNRNTLKSPDRLAIGQVLKLPPK